MLIITLFSLCSKLISNILSQQYSNTDIIFSTVLRVTKQKPNSSFASWLPIRFCQPGKLDRMLPGLFVCFSPVSIVPKVFLSRSSRWFQAADFLRTPIISFYSVSSENPATTEQIPCLKRPKPQLNMIPLVSF